MYFFQEEQIFRRRKLVNNWDRYEGLDVTNDDEDAITHRGADFAALLNVTSMYADFLSIRNIYMEISSLKDIYI